MMNKVFLKNFFSLSFIQVANYLFPLITIPYVMRIIGPEKLGIINLAQALIAYLIIIVNYGFDFTATREISINRHNRQAVSEIFSATFFNKFMLFALTFLIYLVLVSLENYRDYSLVIFFTYISVFANVLFPTWFFQGTEQLTLTATVNFFSRFLILILTFLLIHQQEDYILVPLVTSLGQLTFNLVAFIYAVKSYGINLKLPAFTALKKSLTEGWPIFISAVVINVYLTGSIIILGFYASNESVGYFSAATKVIALVQSILLYPVFQSMFPQLSRTFNEDRQKAILILRKVLIIVSLVTGLGSIIIFVFAKYIILVIFGDKFLDAVTALRIVSILPLVTGISNVIGVQGLVNLKKDKVFLTVTGLGAIISVALNLWLAARLNHLGSSIAWVISELVVMLGMITGIRRLGIRIFDPKEARQLFTKSGLFQIK